MTRTFGENANNDLYLDSNGNLAIVTGLPAVLLLCRSTIEAQLAEMVLAVDQGMPNFQTIWKDAGTVPQFEAAARNRILKVVNVKSIESFDTEIINNQLRYRVVIEATFGRGEINGSSL